MEELGKDMLGHCAGLPLAIIVLGGILATKFSFSDWEKVHGNVKSQLKKGKGQGTVEEVLALSYEELPSNLKPCFLYLSNFPEDYGISADRLIQLWVAEGFISSNIEKENAEDVAEWYLIELAERYMIQIRKSDPLMKIKTCGMHDLMRDLCLSKAKQENFVCILDPPNEDIVISSPSTLDNSSRGVAANNFLSVKCIRNPSLRSVFFFTDSSSVECYLRELILVLADIQNPSTLMLVSILLLMVKILCGLWGTWTYMFNSFKLLRVLNFEAGINRDLGCKLPSNIGKLIHLRFLSLRDITFIRSKLPSSLGNLRCLQTLDLRVEKGCFGFIHVPNVIWRMEELRHLYLPGECNNKTKLNLGTLKNLQTLENFSTKSCYAENLRNMTNLRRLVIRLPFDIEDFMEDSLPMIGSKCLQSLIICGRGDDERLDPRHLSHLLPSCVNASCELSLKVEISKLPEFSSNFACIFLSYQCKINEDPMPTLEKLTNLRILKLYYNSFTGKKMVCSAPHFPALESLSLTNLNHLEEWKVEEGALPALRHLEIKGCSSLKMLPYGLSFITTLQELKIESMPEAFMDKVVEGEDFYKVRHVPSVIFESCIRSLVPISSS